MIDAILAPGEAAPDDHQARSGQLPVGFPVRVQIDGSAQFQVSAEQGQGFIREHGILLAGL